MGLFDKLYDLFDLNRDGEVDTGEAVMAMDLIFGEEEKEEPDTYTEEAELADALEDAGIDVDEFIYGMDDDEREKALEAAGLDPDDYEDFD